MSTKKITLESVLSGRIQSSVIFQLAIILIIAFIVRIPLLNEPIDRDAGLFAVIGRAIANGAVHYRDVTDSKPPGIHFVFALFFKFFNIDFIGINLIAAVWALMSTFFVYLLSVRLFGTRIAFVSALLFAVFSSSPLIEGSNASPENFMILFTVIAFLIFINAEIKNNRRGYFLSGIFAGFALCFKQAALFDFFAILTFVIISTLALRQTNPIRIMLKKIIFLLSGFIVFPVIIIIYFKMHNALDDFLGSVFFHNLKYIYSMGYTASYLYKFFYFNARFAAVNSILWIGSVASILLTSFSLFDDLKQKRPLTHHKETLISIWCIFAFIGVSFGGRFFPHYYTQILPAFSIAAGYFLINLFTNKISSSRVIKGLISVCIIASLWYSFYLNYPFYFIYTPEEISISKYEWEPFVETREVGRYIKQRTQKDDYIYVWAEEPQIYFYADRKSPSKYLNNCQFTYFRDFSPYTESDLMEDLKKDTPVYIIIESKHFATLRNLNEFVNFLREYYIPDREFKIVRNNRWGYSLLLYRLKE